MHFTYEKTEKVYKLRNKMNSTVKTMDEVAVLFNTETGEIKEYGPTGEVCKRHRNLAESGEMQYEMFRSGELNLEVINKVINSEANILHVIDDKTIAGKFFVSYYPAGWKPNVWGKVEKEKPKIVGDIAIGDTVNWKVSSSSRQYKVTSEDKDSEGRRVLTIDYKGAKFTALESDLEKL